MSLGQAKIPVPGMATCQVALTARLGQLAQAFLLPQVVLCLQEVFLPTLFTVLGVPRDGQLALAALCDPLPSCNEHMDKQEHVVLLCQGNYPPSTALQQPRVFCRQFMRAENQQTSHSKLLISLAIFHFFPMKNFPETPH